MERSTAALHQRTNARAANATVPRFQSSFPLRTAAADNEFSFAEQTSEGVDGCSPTHGPNGAAARPLESLVIARVVPRGRAAVPPKHGSLFFGQHLAHVIPAERGAHDADRSRVATAMLAELADVATTHGRVSK